MGVLAYCGAVITALAPFSSAALAQVAPGESACAALRQLQVPGAALSEVTTEWFAAGSPPPQEPPWVPPLAVPLPAYCRLSATLDRRTGADGKSYGIGFALALPAEWNGRFLFQGGGGLNGTVAPPLGRTGQGDAALARGFAVVTTDTGHRGQVFDASFMAEQQASLDFAYQAVGRVAVLAKQIVAQHYGRPAAHAYFMGCSTGGREGMLMAQRYPTYFDGIVVGAPAMRTGFSGIGDEWVATMLNQVAPKDASGKPDGRRAFSDADRKAVIDGLLAVLRRRRRRARRHGLRSDRVPIRSRGLCAARGRRRTAASRGRRSRPSPRRSPVRRTRRGGRCTRASRSTRASPPRRASGAARRQPNPVGPPFTATEMDVDKRAEDAAADPQMQLTATSSWTNLNTFSSRGGKLLFFHGVSDPWFSALDTVDYYERMTRANGGASAVTGWSRLFLVPGMGHCGGGPATLDTLRHAGRGRRLGREPEAPQAIRATGRSWPGRSRPLCPYPSHAHYKGTGDVEDAASFECR